MLSKGLTQVLRRDGITLASGATTNIKLYQIPVNNSIILTRILLSCSKSGLYFYKLYVGSSIFESGWVDVNHESVLGLDTGYVVSGAGDLYLHLYNTLGVSAYFYYTILGYAIDATVVGGVPYVPDGGIHTSTA